MKQYELMTITNINLGEKGSTEISNSVKDLISGNKGKVLNSDNLGKRSFAYKLNKETEGYYEVVTFELEPSALSELKKKMNLINGLERYLVCALN